MRRLLIVILAVLLASFAAAAQRLQPPTAPAEPPFPDAAAPQVVPVSPQPPDDADVFGRSTRSALRIAQDFRLPDGDAVRDAVVILGDATVAGDVDGQLVVILGNVNLEGSAVIRGDFVSVGGTVTVQPGAEARGDFVVVGSEFDGPAGFTPGREYVLVGGGLLGSWLQGLSPYLTRGLVWGRLIVPDLPWIWGVVGIFFLAYVALNALFDRPVRSCATTLAARPLTSFGVGLLVLLLIGPVCLLLAVSVVGIAVVPFLLLALLGAWIVGKVAVARWLGMSIVAEEDASRLQALRSVVLGFAVITIAYMIPVIGIVTWAIVGTLGLGGATLAFLSAYRRENPKPASARSSGTWRPWGGAGRGVSPDVAAAPGVPPAPVPTAYSPDDAAPPAAPPTASGSFVPPEPPPAMAYGTTAGPGGSAFANAMPFSPASAAALPPTFLATMPKALFRDRLAAFVVDMILIVLAINVLGADPDEIFPVIVLAYFVGMWTWKQTTVGGMVCHLRVVRTDGSALTLADALVRGLAGLVSLAVFCVGALWMLRDPESQTWHDKIAGTYVVRVPKAWTA